jgi:predicted DCC family thiol-disulfide oxidoreductase YuxK
VTGVPGDRPTLIFDDACGVCRAWASRVRADWGTGAEVTGAGALGCARLAGLGVTSARARGEVLWVHDGHCLGGADAVAAALRSSTRTWHRVAGSLLAWGVVRPLASATYRLVVAHRGAWWVRVLLGSGRD